MNRWIALLGLMMAGVSVGCTTAPRNTYGTAYAAPAYPATTYSAPAYPATAQYVPATYQPTPGPVTQPPQIVYQQPAVAQPPQIVYQQPAVAQAPQVIYQQPAQPTVGYAPQMNYVTPASACQPCVPNACTCR